MRDDYSNFKFFEMMGCGIYNDGLTGAAGSLSGTAMDTRGYETVTFICNIGSALNVNPLSNQHITLMHASVDDSVSYVFVSSSDLFGSDITFNSEYRVSFGGSMRLGLTGASGVIFDTSVATASIADANSTWCFGYKGRERYVKFMMDSVGGQGTGSMVLCIMGMMGRAANWPVNDPNP